MSGRPRSSSPSGGGGGGETVAGNTVRERRPSRSITPIQSPIPLNFSPMSTPPLAGHPAAHHLHSGMTSSPLSAGPGFNFPPTTSTGLSRSSSLSKHTLPPHHHHNQHHQESALSTEPSPHSSNPNSAAVSRRNSLAHGPPRIPGLPRRRDSTALFIPEFGYDGPNPTDVLTPSLLSRAGSPTLPLMNERTRSESTSRKGSFSGGQGGQDARTILGGGFGGGALEMSMATRKKKEGEFVGSVDCGTTSTRFIVFDQYARIVCEHQQEFKQHYPHPGWHEHEPQDLIDSVNECITKAMEKLDFVGFTPASVKCIGITNQRETTLCWDKNTGKALCRAIVWDDARTVPLVRELQKKLDEEGISAAEGEKDTSGSVQATIDGALGVAYGLADQLRTGLGLNAGKETSQGPTLEPPMIETDASISGLKRRRKGKDALVDITGLPLSTYFSAVKLRWMIDQHPDVRRAYEEDRLAVGTVDSWLCYNLTGGAAGGIHVMDATNASRTLLMSLKTMQWYQPLLEFFGFKESILPKIASSSEVYGNIASGPLQGVPIAGMIGDQQAALVGNKCLSKGEAKNTYGTGSFVLFNTGHDVVRSAHGLITTVAYQLGPKAKPTYALEGSIAVAGSAIKWLRDQIGLIEESSEMDALCSNVKDTGGVYFVTAFSGLLAPYWDSSASGTIIGLTQYSTSAHIARATLEAVCFQSRAVLDVIEKESGVKLEELKVDGGVTNSDLAMQIQADIGGFRVCRPQMRESTALGSALLAGSALKLFGWDLSQPKTLLEVNTSEAMFFEPEISEAKRLKMIRGWEKAVSRAKDWHTVEEENEVEGQSEGIEARKENGAPRDMES